MAGPLDGKRILVTGASSGIGEATAVALVTAGAAVAGVARRADRLAVLHEVHGVHPVPADLTDPAAAAVAVTDAVAALGGGLDGLVNCAGISRPALIADADPADWQAMFALNVIGLLAVTQAGIPHLRRAGEGASIVNVSSMSGRRVPAAAGGTYAATKFAVHAISESLRQELQPYGVRVTTISPGFVATDIFAGQVGAVAERYRTLSAAVGLAAADVAAAIVHTLSAPASVTTVEVALVPTRQDDARYARSVSD